MTSLLTHRSNIAAVRREGTSLFILQHLSFSAKFLSLFLQAIMMDDVHFVMSGECGKYYQILDKWCIRD